MPVVLTHHFRGLVDAFAGIGALGWAVMARIVVPELDDIVAWQAAAAFGATALTFAWRELRKGDEQ